MHIDRMAAVFGSDALGLADDYDLTDDSERIAFVGQFTSIDDSVTATSVTAMRSIIVGQILDNDPPEAWQTFQRLTGLGLDAENVLGQLTMLMAEHLSRALRESDPDTPFDPSSYIEALATLPLPTAADIAKTMFEIVRRQPGISADDHDQATAAAFAHVDEEVAMNMIDPVLESLVVGPLWWAPRDRTYVVADLTDGATFTHRLSGTEISMGTLNVGFDLGPFRRFDIITLDDGTEIEPFSVEAAHTAWRGPDGWLDRFDDGDLLACTAQIEASDDPFGPMVASVAIRVIDDPATDPGAVDCVRAAYDALVAEPDLPVDGDDIGWLCLVNQPDLFAQPQLPLGELAAGSGLEQWGSQVAHDPSVWRNQAYARRLHDVYENEPDNRWRNVLGEAVRVLDDPEATDDVIRKALAECAEPETLDTLTNAFFGDRLLQPADEFELDGPDAPGRLFQLVDRAIAVAKRPREVATAHYLAAALAERCAEPDKAEQHLKRANDAAERLGPVVDRLGWYCFDRGDAKGAMRWWRTLSQLPEAAETIQEFLTPMPKANRLGRNDPCWCGSGRKFKKCHQDASELPALPDRVGWLCRKAIVWLEHASTDTRMAVVELAAVRATGDPEVLPEDLAGNPELGEQFAAAFEDPIVFDAALHEVGLWSMFLRDRGPLLPDDEQLLAASWLTVDRSVHEVVEVDPGVGMTVRNLASGDRIDVREQSASQQLNVGQRFCARVVPDGASNQIIGGVFEVRTGHETAVLDLCEAGDAVELCAWVGSMYQPARIRHTTGMAEEMFDFGAMDELLSGLDIENDREAAMAALSEEMSRQAQARWLDESVPALGGRTPREAAADPTMREQLERLLAEFNHLDQQLPEGMNAIAYDTDAMRRELGLS